MSKQDVYSLLLPFIPSDYHFLEARHRHRLFLPCKGTADERLTKYRRATLLKFDEKQIFHMNWRRPEFMKEYRSERKI